MPQAPQLPQLRAAPLSVSAGTRYLDRVIDALALLCGGKQPPRELVVQWEDGTSEELQSWAVSNIVVRWGTGIGAIEAAQAMADAPEEGVGHEYREDAYPGDYAEGPISPTAPAAELKEKLERAFGDDWELSLSAGGNGSIVTPDETIYVGSARKLDELLDEELTKQTSHEPIASPSLNSRPEHESR